MKKTVMVVDSYMDFRMLIGELLVNDGYKVVTAENGDDCLKKLENHNPDLILMNIMMYGTPVQEVVKKIKGIKIAIVSALQKDSPEGKELLKQENVVDFIEKTFDIDIFLKKVKSLTS